MANADTQRKEFQAGDQLAKQLRRLSFTPVVDNDYPEVRHDYETALSSLIDAMKENGRFSGWNKYGLTPSLTGG